VAHTRLAIVDVEHGHQPMFGDQCGSALVCNGEIYNHRALRGDLEARHHFATRSDSEVILHLFEEEGATCLHRLDGMFAFFAADETRFVAARDALGIKPLYYARDRDGFWFASELKSLLKISGDVAELPPGAFLDEAGTVGRWFSPAWADAASASPAVSSDDLVPMLERAVVKRLMSDVPVGVFLSGGLDSSVVAALARRHVGRLDSFAVGFEGASDLASARTAARALGTTHHECRYDTADLESGLERVIFHLESYDEALIRSALPNYFLCRLASQHVKVALTGEGADEVFAGYGYFAEIRTAQALQAECVRLLFGLHNMNLQRVDRMTMAHGIEGRVPFLDLEFLDWAMRLNPELKLHRPGAPEKTLLRLACEGLLPHEIAWRPKQEFSRGAGVDAPLGDYAKRMVSDAEIARAAQRFPDDPPRTKEAVLYRTIFESFFPGAPARRTVGRWNGRTGALARSRVAVGVVHG